MIMFFLPQGNKGSILKDSDLLYFSYIFYLSTSYVYIIPAHQRSVEAGIIYTKEEVSSSISWFYVQLLLSTY